jgi:Plasmid encoded RepA protein
MARETKAVKVASLAARVWDRDPVDAVDMAFVSRIMVQAFLPHSDPKDLAWQRVNGNFSLTVKSGIGFENGKSKTYGIPYGTIPRLLLAWLNSEAFRNSQDSNNENPQCIQLGRSLSDFLEKIGVPRTGGCRGGITAFKNQAERLFRSEITITCTGEDMVSERDMKIADGRVFFWSHTHPGQTTLWESAIELSDRFYALLIRNPVPLDWEVLREIKQSPMALDLYMWLTHRMSYLQEPVNIRWETLEKQLGSDISNSRKFRQQVRKHLKTIQAVWKDLQIDVSKAEHLRLSKTKSLIPHKKSPLSSKKKAVQKIRK